ncbi:MAG: RND family transporter [Alphaproteobacteria bacterium]
MTERGQSAGANRPAPPVAADAVGRFFDWLIRRRFLVLAVSLLACAAAASGVVFLTFDIDYRVYFSKDNPQLAAFEALQNVYTKQDNILFVLAPEDGDALSPTMLDVVERLTDAAWHIPYARRVDSVTNFQNSYAEGDDLVIEDLVSGALELPAEEIARVRKTALAEPLLVDRLLAPAGDVTGVNVTLQLPGKDLVSEVPKAVAFARKLARRVEAENPSVRVYLTGVAMLNNAFPEASIADLETLVPIMFVVLVGALILCLRSLAGAFATLVVVAMSTATAMGIAGWAGFFLTPPSVAAPITIMTLAVADSVHILMSFRVECRRGAEKWAALAESLRINRQPVFLTSLTTVIGFLSMNASDAPPLRDLGNIAAIGVVAAFLYSITALPALIAILPAPAVSSGAGARRVVSRAGGFVVRRRGALLWGTGIVMVLLAAFVPRIELNDDFVDYFDRSTVFRHDTDFTNRHLTGIYTLQYDLKAGGEGGIADPAYLAVVDRFADWFRAQPGVRHVNAVTDIIKRLNRNLHGDDPAYYRLPETRELASQYLLLYELSLPLGLDLNDQINIDKSATRFVATLDTMTTREIREIDARAGDWLAANAPSAMAGEGTSTIMMFAHISERNIRSMLGGTAAGILLIAVALAFALRSVKFGLISLLPNTLPMLLALGVWGLVVGRAGLAVSVIAAMTLGIIVDDTVHFLSKYLRARRERDLDPAAAVQFAFDTVGDALATTSLILFAGFLVLAQSSFRMNWEMGYMAAITIAIALAADLLFLPALLMKIDGRSDRRLAVSPRPTEDAPA